MATATFWTSAMVDASDCADTSWIPGACSVGMTSEWPGAKELSGSAWKAAARSSLAIQIAVRSANRSQNTQGTDEILSGAQWRCPRGRPKGSASSELRSGGRMACAAALPRSAGPAGEEAGDLVGGVPLEGVGADVVAGQGGLRAGAAQQALDVAQRNALIEPDRADGAPERVRPDGPADPGDLRGAGDVAVHRAAVHAGAGGGPKQRSTGGGVYGRLHRRQGGQGHRHPGGLVSLADEGQGHIAANSAQGLHGQAGHLTGS